jgi:hypothetical protein
LNDSGNTRRVLLILTGDKGELVYPDGRARQLKVLAVDQAQILAQYERTIIIGHITGSVEINRMTEGLRVVRGSDVAFRGACPSEPTDPKF